MQNFVQSNLAINLFIYPRIYATGYLKWSNPNRHLAERDMMPRLTPPFARVANPDACILSKIAELT